MLIKFNSGRDQEAKSLYQHNLSSEPETPPDSGIRGNSTRISFRKARHAVSTPFLFLGFYVVRIVIAQSLQLGMVSDNLQMQIQSAIVFSLISYNDCERRVY